MSPGGIVEVHPALVRRGVHVDDAIAVAGLAREGRVDVVLHGAHDPVRESDQAQTDPSRCRKRCHVSSSPPAFDDGR